MGGGVYKSRVKNSRRNVISGAIRQIVSIGLQFVLRTTIIYILGAEYQGLNGLFTSILTILNLSDLGFSAAVTFILYKPIAEGNQEEINSILAYLKKVYYIIGTVVLAIGLIIMPFLPRLISGNYPADINIYVLFSIYLINSVISYFLFAYNNALLTAYQREDIVSNSFTITLFISRSIQIILLFIYRNYYFYAIMLPLGSIFNNLLVQYYSKKYFPQSIPSGIIDRKIKNELNSQVKAVFVDRISDVARNSFDNIVLSSMLGLVAVTVYDNYYYIYSAIIGFMGVLVHGVKASIGNSLVAESVEKNKKDLDTFTFIFMWIAGWFTVCLFSLYQPFMEIWMKGNTELILSFGNMTLFCVYFYSMSMTYSKNAYLEAKGLFKECQKWYVSEAIMNLLLNILLGYLFGITGILIATILTILVLNFFGGTKVLFDNYFQDGRKKYFAKHILYACVTVICSVITWLLCSVVNFNSILGMICKIAICTIIPNILFWLIYHRMDVFKRAKATIQTTIKK